MLDLHLGGGEFLHQGRLHLDLVSLKERVKTGKLKRLAGRRADGNPAQAVATIVQGQFETFGQVQIRIGPWGALPGDKGFYTPNLGIITGYLSGKTIFQQAGHNHLVVKNCRMPGRAADRGGYFLPILRGRLPVNTS